MKNKYQRMDKEEKQKLRKKYSKTTEGKGKIARLNRLFIIGVIGIVISIGLFISAIINNNTVLDYISAGILLVFSIVFIIGSLNIRQKEYNKFALKQK